MDNNQYNNGIMNIQVYAIIMAIRLSHSINCNFHETQLQCYATGCHRNFENFNYLPSINFNMSTMRTSEVATW